MSAGMTRNTARELGALPARVPKRLRPLYAIAALFAATLSGASSTLAAPCWQPPVTAAVVDPYRQPGCRWCPGNRGIEYDTTSGDIVTAVSAGTVSFSGAIAGVHYVVVEIANRWRVTYGNLSNSEFTVGDTIVAGMAIGTAAGAFHFGLRVGDTYTDPAPYLGEWQFRVRLVPTDGAPAAPGPSPTLRCELGAPSPFLRGVPGREPSHRR